MPDPIQDPLARASTTPDVTYLHQEYSRAKTDSGMAARLAVAEDTRFCRWPGQTEDGLKHQDQMQHGEKVQPWDAASDARVPLSDSVINDLTDLLSVAFWNARPRTQGVYANRLTAMQSAELRQLLTWLIHGAMGERLVDEVELAAQAAGTIGHVLVHTCWRTEYTVAMQTLTLEGILALALRNPQGPEAALFMATGDPATQAQAAELLRQWFPHLTLSRAGRVVAELRDAGTAEFPVRRQVRNLPEVTVLRPGDDCFVPPETSELATARVIFRRVFLSAQAVEQFGTEDGWDGDFITAACNTASNTGKDWPSGFDVTTAFETQNLVEIAYAYSRSNDADGVPGVYCTVFCPGVNDKVGKHYLLDYAHGDYPFKVLRLEVTSRRLLDSRGVPETFVATAQTAIKKTQDSLVNRSDLELMPPLVKTGARNSQAPELGPNGRVYQLTPDEWKFFEPPRGSPQLGLNLMEVVQNQVDDYFGRLSEKTPPTLAQMRQQRLVNRWLASWAGVFHQCAVLCYQYLDPEELAQILGRPPMLTAEELTKHRLLFWFDVRSLNSEWINEFMTTMATVIAPLDKSGTIDSSKLVELLLAYLDPVLAEEITMPKEGAAQAIFQKVRHELMAIQTGNEPLLEDASNDPTGEMKLQFANQVFQTNPQLQQAAQQQPLVGERLKKYVANLEQASVQQQNKQTGRLGVKANGEG